MRTKRSTVRSLTCFGVESRSTDLSNSLIFIGGGVAGVSLSLFGVRLRGRDMRLFSCSRSLVGTVLFLLLLLLGPSVVVVDFALSPLRGCSRLSRFEISISCC